MTLDQLAAEALNLPREERAELADRLFESLDTGELTATDKLWASEAKRRADELLSGQVQGLPGEEVLAEARRRARQ
jgi:putative addiction module component (TIGR02574 family)